MKLSDIAIKVTNRNRKAVIAWLENINRPPSSKESSVLTKDCFIIFRDYGKRGWVSVFNLEGTDVSIVNLSKAKRIYEKENKPQPTHAELKSERGRSAMYKFKYEEAKKHCHKLYAMLDAGATEAIRRERELRSELDSYKETIEGLKISKKELNIEFSDLEDKNSKLTNEVKEQVKNHTTFKRIAITAIVILTSIILYGLA